MEKAECDIIISLPDKSVSIVWQFFKGATWPRSDNGTLLFKGKVEMFIVRPPILPDNQRVLYTMREWYEESRPVIISHTIPAELTAKDEKDLILALLGSFIEHERRTSLDNHVVVIDSMDTPD